VTVVDEVYDEETEISLEDARKLDPEAELDDDLGEKLDNIADLGRIAAQSAKQVIIHRMRDAERDVIYEMYRDREGTIVNGIVQRFERGDMIINLGRTDAILPRDGQIPKRVLSSRATGSAHTCWRFAAMPVREITAIPS
jgi:transcription termination/antitermination protein NusA